jgi:ribonuclease D
LAKLFVVVARAEVVGHNLASFDLPFLARLGFRPDRVFDTLLASKVVNGGDDVGHGLADAAERELGKALDKSHQTDDWSGMLTPATLAYAAADAAVLVPLAEALVAKADAAGLTAVLDLEMRAAVPVARMAAAGVGFDTTPCSTPPRPPPAGTGSGPSSTTWPPTRPAYPASRPGTGTAGTRSSPP